MEFYRNMNAKYLAVVAALAVMLVAATAFATTDSVFAGGGHGHKKKGGYEKSQATSQVNNCGNKFMPENVWCQNTASQTQGEDNSVALRSTQGEDGGHHGGNGGGPGGRTRAADQGGGPGDDDE